MCKLGAETRWSEARRTRKVIGKRRGRRNYQKKGCTRRCVKNDARLLKAHSSHASLDGSGTPGVSRSVGVLPSQTAKGAKIYSAAIAATAEAPRNSKEGEEKIKLHTHSYSGFCICERGLNQFGFQIYDVVSYRLHRLRKKLKDELENKNAVQEYICPNCGRRYNALDALRLISPADEYFHCENCNGELVAESDKLAAQEGGDGDDNARRRRREKLKDMLQKMEVQLKPLMDQLSRVKDLPVLEFGSLQAWEARASAAGRPANGDSSSNDPSKSSQGLGFGRTPMTFIGETKAIRVKVTRSMT
ncbi:uncharacterized protein LOC110646863 [Hevea brasiliensis]|uniref:uncharacterized protein LOC110646863 n=1 Tax=Hevea brasiliensis TaxID=3981 RepID=UPI0025CFC7E0|nr:uncharacterized protein LOC110646863 [Hevea brasiliensis]